jgi:hypothetical protein
VSAGAGRRIRWRLILPIALIALGLVLTTYFGLRAGRSFRELRYIHEQGLDRGTAGVDAIRPWMSLRFVAVAYAVPEEYLYSALDIPFDRRKADRPLGMLNRDYVLGEAPNSQAPDGREPAILPKARAAITAYRADPVATGLRDVRPWMSIRYIANTSGVPEADILAQLDIPSDGDIDAHASKPLDILADELKYPGGLRALIDDILEAVPGAEPPDDRPPPPR